MKTQEFTELENRVLDTVEKIKDARHAYLTRDWLSDEMYTKVFLEKIKELKTAIDEAIEANVF